MLASCGNGPRPAILVAGVGNELRADDGAGLVVARRLMTHRFPPGTVIREYGINGMALVQDLMEGFDALIVLDAAQRRGRSGDLHVVQCWVPPLAEMPERERRDFLADIHWTNPNRALVLAQALGVLPPKVFLVGIEPSRVDDLAVGLTVPVMAAVNEAVAAVWSLLDQIGGRSPSSAPVATLDEARYGPSLI